MHLTPHEPAADPRYQELVRRTGNPSPKSWRALRLVALVILALGATLAVAHAQGNPLRPSGQPEPEVVTLRLVDGSTIRGVLIEEGAGHVVIETRTLGQLRIPREFIEDTVGADSTGVVPKPRSFDPDYNSVLLGPTPETLPRGTGYFRSFEVLILNCGLAPTDNLNLSLATLFPISSDFGMLSAGFKYRLLSREKHPIGLAIAGNATLVDGQWLGTLSGITGIGDRHRSLNVSLHAAFTEDDDSGLFYMVSGDVQFSRSAKFLAEFGNSSSRIIDDEDVDGFINVGVRMFWGRTSFTITGLRPLTDDNDGLIAIPVVMFSRHW